MSPLGGSNTWYFIKLLLYFAWNIGIDCVYRSINNELQYLNNKYAKSLNRIATHTKIFQIKNLLNTIS